MRPYEAFAIQQAAAADVTRSRPTRPSVGREAHRSVDLRQNQGQRIGQTAGSQPTARRWAESWPALCIYGAFALGVAGARLQSGGLPTFCPVGTEYLSATMQDGVP